MTRQTIDDELAINDNPNWAGHVDALSRQGSQRKVLISERIPGRRMRDRYLDQATVFKPAHSRSGED